MAPNNRDSIERNDSPSSPSSYQKKEGFLFRVSRFLSFSDDYEASDMEPVPEYNDALDLDMMESGVCRNVISKEILLPSSSNQRWRNCHVVRTTKKTFKLYTEDIRAKPHFLMSAKWVGDCFYLSQYEDFCEEHDGVPQYGFCGIVRQTSDRTFRVMSCSCEGCDDALDKYTCGGASCETGGRQVLAEVSHHLTSAGGFDMRTFRAQLPSLEADGKSRVVWCPRGHSKSVDSDCLPQFKENIPSTERATPRRRRLEKLKVADTGSTLSSALPKLDREAGSLVMSFVGGRIRKASAKNCILKVASKSHDGKKVSERHVLQFGRMKKAKTYAMDYRAPIAPIQAFGIVLSTFAWKC